VGETVKLTMEENGLKSGKQQEDTLSRTEDNGWSKVLHIFIQ
jgi:hypothetical protein